ncbi:secretion/DNA translocation related CpaE-like protein [Nonomuraea fuscirosea]|uniref:Secretion/DNA translocation related CpaE-like protein n=1 Tax=Nonomuraea fuscirosea TaxID=1291556 RepID=A0A2T0MZ49_9ACTN|nr:septum site-determining protein Ssd [Nonomuraea fuscirosea]PRX64662.1 secretion/DNA translocation related CpaE-like protein [Nonomuraea fuscirosea]
MNRPLVITEDHALLDDLVRIAAAAGAQLDVAHVPAHARPFWNLAPLVAIGADQADAVAATSPPTRDQVLLVTRDLEDQDSWRKCVAVGAQSVIALPADERRLVDLFADAMDPDPRSGSVICVIGGRGGAGASVLAACLALRASADHLRTLLVDADRLGGGIDALLGHEEAPGARWGDLVAREGRINASALQAALPAFGDLAVLSFHRGEVPAIPAQAMRSVLEAGRRGFDLVVVDLPRHLDEAAIEALTRAKTTLTVATADVRGVLSTVQILSEVRKHTADVRAVLRPGVVDDDTVMISLGIPSAGTLPDQPRLTATLNRGELPRLGPRTVLGALCTSLLRDLLPAT